MNFKSASKVRDTIRAGDQVAMIRGENRSRINNMANGAPPLDESEATKMGVRINSNFGEMPVAFQHARRQYLNAFQRPGNFFRVTIPLAPVEKQRAWGINITRTINRILKRSRPFFELYRNKFASVVAHGIGPQMWPDGETWLPEFVAIEDFRVATDTKVDLTNLEWFAVRRVYTEGELADKVFGPNSNQFWNKPALAKILHDIHDKNYDSTDTAYSWLDTPEKMYELVKQNLGFFTSDAVPSIPLWHFYFKDRVGKTRKTVWKLRVVPTDNVAGAPEDEFLYDAKAKPEAQNISHLLHIQFGDLNNKAPFLFWSVRSLGFLLVEPCFWTNLTRCRFLQHVHEQFNAWLRISDPAGSARAQLFEAFDKCIVPEGVSVVPQTERHQVDRALVESALAQLKQLMGEAAASYTQETDTGTQKERTAYETSVQLAKVNAMMSGLLLLAFVYETFAYKEICRRFCLSNSMDDDVQEFQAACIQRHKIPRRWLNVEDWDVEPEVPIGAGSPSMAIAQIKQLLELRPSLPPQAQMELLHEAVEVISDNPDLAERWIPSGQGQVVSSGQERAELAFGTLMQAVPVHLKPDLSPIDQIETWLGLMAGVIARIEQQTNLASPNELAGLQNVQMHIQELLQQLGQDPTQKEVFVRFSKQLGKLANALKGFAQRLQESQQQNNGSSGLTAEDHGKIAAMMTKASVDTKIREQKALQTQRHKEIGFRRDQGRKDVEVAAELTREHVKTEAEVGRKKYAAYSGGDE